MGIKVRPWFLAWCSPTLWCLLRRFYKELKPNWWTMKEEEVEEGANQEEARQDQGAFLCTACGFASKVLPLFDIKGKLKPTWRELENEHVQQQPRKMHLSSQEHMLCNALRGSALTDFGDSAWKTLQLLGQQERCRWLIGQYVSVCVKKGLEHPGPFGPKQRRLGASWKPTPHAARGPHFPKEWLLSRSLSPVCFVFSTFCHTADHNNLRLLRSPLPHLHPSSSARTEASCVGPPLNDFLRYKWVS